MYFVVCLIRLPRVNAPTSFQSFSHAMETTIHAMVQRDRPPDSSVYCRPKREGNLPNILLHILVNTLPSFPGKVALSFRLTRWWPIRTIDHTSPKRWWSFSLRENGDSYYWTKCTLYPQLCSEEWSPPSKLIRNLASQVWAWFHVLIRRLNICISQQPLFGRMTRSLISIIWLVQSCTRPTGCKYPLRFCYVNLVKLHERDLAVKGHIANVQVLLTRSLPHCFHLMTLLVLVCWGVVSYDSRILSPVPPGTVPKADAPILHEP